MSHRKGVYVGKAPIYDIEVRSAGGGSYYLLSTTYSISGKSTINCDVLQDGAQALAVQYAFETNFPPSAVRFAPRSVCDSHALVMTAGEAIGVWDQGVLTGFCVPEALKSVGMPLAGREGAEQPVWGVTAARWTEHRPAVIVAAHRSGSLGIYHVDRLPGAGRITPTAPPKPSGIFDRFAKLFSTPANTPARANTQAEVATGNGCQVFAQMPTTPNRRLSPGPAPKSTASFFCTDIQTLDANIVVAAQNADSSLSLFDTREKPQQLTPRAISGGHPKFIEGLGDNCLMTLDKIREEVHVYDVRTLANNSIRALETFHISDIFGYPLIVNDALVLRSTEVVMALQRDQSRGEVKTTEGVLAKFNLESFQGGTCQSKSCIGNVLSDDNCGMALAADDDMLFWVEMGVYMPGNENEWMRVGETPYTGEALRSSQWLEASGTWIHMLPLR